jgi:hypothetical protein
MDACESARNTRLWSVEEKKCRRKELKKLFNFRVKSRKCQRQDSADLLHRASALRSVTPSGQYSKRSRYDDDISK